MEGRGLIENLLEIHFDECNRAQNKNSRYAAVNPSIGYIAVCVCFDW